MKPWWERFPAVYEEEISQLEAAGIPFTRDQGLWDAGVLQLRLHPRVDGREVELIATYPDLYPYFRFEVRAPGEANLVRHREPFGGVLCLIGRRGENWQVDDRLAWFIQNQVPKVLRLGTATADENDLEAGEEHQGEPFSEYYPYARDALLVIDSAWKLPSDVHAGTLRLLVEPRTDGIVRGVVAEVRDCSGNVLSAYPAPDVIYSQRLEARWFRVPTVIQESDPEEALAAVAEIHDDARRPRPQRLGSVVVDVNAVIFPEEVRWREAGDGWFFIVRAQAARQPNQRRTPAGYYFARAGRAGVNDLVQRVPELEPLRQRTIAIIGLGGLGAPSALEFARAQVGTLRLCDHDFVDPGTSVRWPLGVPAAGISKVRLGSFIEQQWPFVKAEQYVHRLGGFPAGPDDQRDINFVDEFLDGVDLVYDASADLGVQYFLSEQARDRGVAYIALDATVGAWGGKIVRVVPEVTEGCWLCSRAAFDAGTIHLPPADPQGDVQTAGCADVTFTGSAFDLLPIVAAGVRLAVATVSPADSGYPDVDWDVGVLSLRNQSGVPTPAAWTTHRLERHSRCPVCVD